MEPRSDLYIGHYRIESPMARIRGTTPSSRREPPVAWQGARVILSGDEPDKMAPPPLAGQDGYASSVARWGVPSCLGPIYAAFTAWTNLVRESLASPKNMIVFGSYISSLSMPAKPGRIERFMNTMFLAWSTFRIGMP